MRKIAITNPVAQALLSRYSVQAQGFPTQDGANDALTIIKQDMTRRGLPNDKIMVKKIEQVWDVVQDWSGEVFWIKEASSAGVARALDDFAMGIQSASGTPTPTNLYRTR